jgi:hypothetical protein
MKEIEGDERMRGIKTRRCKGQNTPAPPDRQLIRPCRNVPERALSGGAEVVRVVQVVLVLQEIGNRGAAT